MKRKTFTFRSSWFEAIRNQPDHIRLSLIDAICRYAIDGELPSGLDPVAEIAFVLIRAEIDSAASPRRKAKASGTQAETAAGESRPAPAAPDPRDGSSGRQPEPAEPHEPDAYDIAYDAIAKRICKSTHHKSLLAARCDIRDIDAALDDFKKFIRNYKRTEIFTTREVTDNDFCRWFIEAYEIADFLSEKALQPPVGQA